MWHYTSGAGVLSYIFRVCTKPKRVNKNLEVFRVANKGETEYNCQMQSPLQVWSYSLVTSLCSIFFKHLHVFSCFAFTVLCNPSLFAGNVMIKDTFLYFASLFHLHPNLLFVSCLDVFVLLNLHRFSCLHQVRHFRQVHGVWPLSVTVLTER